MKINIRTVVKVAGIIGGLAVMTLGTTGCCTLNSHPGCYPKEADCVLRCVDQHNTCFSENRSNCENSWEPCIQTCEQ
uniref:Uncharacterized protein n=1 Tax=Candidatus Kentrum sp. FW TaxID=2126338 RepID=A0A450TMZ9_9GAMM|nr:MAG: hypothetical protein BECKFW1821B_GA0114236_11597 [Candidatus Kentron sp. FW]